MSQTRAKIVANINAEIARLSADVLVETNEGTFSDRECCRATGSGDPRYGNYRVYETLDGKRRVVGCDPAEAPGYARRFDVPSASARRAKVKELQALLEAARDFRSYNPILPALTSYLVAR